MQPGTYNPFLSEQVNFLIEEIRTKSVQVFEQVDEQRIELEADFIMDETDWREYLADDELEALCTLPEVL